MKNKKLTLVIIVLVMVLQCIMPVSSEIFAIESGVLLKSSGVVIRENSTLQDVIRQYGAQPVLSTPSLFGGTTNSFIKSDYTDYLYIETDSKGNVIAAGAASDNFESKLKNVGDKFDGRVSYMQGRVIDDWENGAVGVLVYNDSKLTNAIVKDCKNKYKENKEYEKYVCEHSVILTNYFMKKEFNTDVLLEFDEDLYYTLAKLEDTSDLTIEDYCTRNNKSNYMKIANYDTGYLANYEALPNPFRIAQNTMNYVPTSNKNLAYIRYSLKDSGNDARIWLSYIDKGILNGLKEIELSQEEITKFNNASERYQTSVDLYNSNGNDVYITEPQYQTANLVAGKIYENKLRGAVEFLNAIRLAGGLPTVQYDAELCDIAQHKSVLVVYANNFASTKPTNPHYPPNYPEISDDFYNRAMQNMSGENLYSGNLITSIPNAINDGYGDPVQCGHRYNLLDPSWAKFGIGLASGQATHRFAGSQSTSGITAVCWPQIGITPVEAYSGGYWTCMIYSGYAFTDDTTVEVECLNNDYTYTFTPGESSFTHKCVMYKGIRLISFYDADIQGKDGYAYDITIKNVKNTNTQNIEDFTYRTIFKKIAGGSVSSLLPSGIELDKKAIGITMGNKSTLNHTIIGEGATEIVATYTSADENIATVNQYGVVTAKNPGTTTITVKTVNGHEDTCTINVLEYQKGDMNTDNYVNSTDAALVIDCFKNNVATQRDYDIGDMDENNMLNATDAAMILDIFKSN